MSDTPQDSDEVPLGHADTVISGKHPAIPASAVPPAPAAPGARVGRYRILKMLGRGGMASVFLAEEEGAGRHVALKVMNAALRDDPSFIQRFLHEAKATARLSHPNIVGVLDAGEADGQYYLATEFIDGGTVGALLAKMRELPAALAAEVVVQVLAGLAHAHAQGVVHRDLKPENLLITSTGTVKVADFGIARTADGGAKLTSTGMLIGTAGYMSPEQARGAKVDPRSDLYVVGIILYELLAGVNPYAADNPATSITRIMTNAALPIAAVKAAAPAALEAVLDQLLQLDADARLPSAQAAHDALLPFIAERRRTQPGLLAAALQRPAEVKQLLDTQTADLLVAEARPLLDGDGLTRSRAALKLCCALLHDAQHAEARRVLEGLQQQQRFYFGPTQNPKLQELERLIHEQPDAAQLLQQAAQLSRLEGNPLKASVYLKRYLRLRPADAYAAQQLAQLTGEKPALPRGPTTKELVAGIKTGGFAAMDPARASAPRTPGSAVAPRPSAPPLGPADFDLVGTGPVATQSQLPGLLSKVALLLATVGVLALGYRWISRFIDTEAERVMTEDQKAWDKLSRRRPRDAGVPAEGPVLEPEAEPEPAP